MHVLGKLSDEHKGYGLVFLAGILWGSIGVFVKIMADAGASAELTSFLRLASATLILLPLCIAKFGLKGLLIDRKTLVVSVFLGVFCLGCCSVLYCLAIEHVGVGISAVLMNSAPVFTFLFSLAIFKEQPHIFKVAAIMLCVVGCTLAATNGELSLASLSLVGIIAGIGAGFCYGLTSVVGKLGIGNSNPYCMTMYSTLFATLLLSFWIQPWQGMSGLNETILIAGLLFGLIPTVMAYLVYYRGVDKIKENSKIPVIASVETVVALFLGVALFGETIGALSWLGIGLVLISILLMNVKFKHMSANEAVVQTVN